MKDMTEIRNGIDAIDDEIVDLFCKRMSLCEEAALVKQANGGSVLQTERERAILERVRARTPERWARCAEVWYETLMTASKGREYSLLRSVPNCLNEEIPSEATFPKQEMVACQGEEGSCSQQVANQLFPGGAMRYFPTLDGVFSAVKDGSCEYGVLPIENSEGGSVAEVYRLAVRDGFFIVRSVRRKTERRPAVLSESVQDNSNHCTRFVCIARRPYFSEENNKISISVSVSNLTGALYSILCKFSMAEINLTKIESRPEGNGRSLLYLDFDGNVRDEKVRALLADLEKNFRFVFLGNYRETV